MRDTMRLRIIQKFGVSKRTHPTAPPADTRQRKGHSSRPGATGQDTICCSVGTDHLAQKLWKCDISLHFPLPNEHRSLANLCVCVCMCAYFATQCKKHHILNQIILSPSSSLLATQDMQPNPNNPAIQRSQRHKGCPVPLPVPALENSLNATAKQCNCDHTSLWLQRHLVAR